MFTCTVFQNTFSFSFFLRFNQAVFVSPHLNPYSVYILPRYFPFVVSLHPVQTWPLWLLGHVVRVCHDNRLWSAWCCGGFQRFKTVILSKRERRNFSKWTSKGLLRIETTSINCFRILLWPKWRSVGCRYIYYTTLSAQNLLISWLYCQGKLVLNPTGTLKGTLWPVVISPW